MAAPLVIGRLALNQFRSHPRAVLEPGPGAVALYGPNGAGKTNVLEAVSMLSPGRGLRRASVEDMARRPEGRGWKVAARLDGGVDPREVETFADLAQGARRVVRIDGKAAAQTALGDLLRMVWLTPAMDRLWTEGASERRRFLDRAALSFEPGHADAALAYEKAMRERNRLLKDGASDARWYGALEAQMAEAGARIAGARVRAVEALQSAQEGAATAFPTARIAAEGEVEARYAQAARSAGAEAAEKVAGDWLRGALAAGRREDMAAGRARSGPHRSDLSAIYAGKEVEARLCSTGEQKALLISLVLANARALARREGAHPVLLLDEVAAHLDADRRAALYAEVAALGAQAWMTGTGPELFETLPEGAARYAVTDRDGASLVERVG